MVCQRLWPLTLGKETQQKKKQDPARSRPCVVDPHSLTHSLTRSLLDTARPTLLPPPSIARGLPWPPVASAARGSHLTARGLSWPPVATHIIMQAPRGYSLTHSLTCLLPRSPVAARGRPRQPVTAPWSSEAHRCSPPPVATCRPGRCGRGCINMLASRVHTEKSDTCRPVGFPRAGIHLATPRVISAIQILCEPHAQEPWHKCKFALPWVSENTRWKTPWEHQEINKVMKKRVAIEMCTSTRFISCSSWHVPDAMCQRRAWKSTVRQISSSKYRLHTYLTVLTQ